MHNTLSCVPYTQHGTGGGGGSGSHCRLLSPDQSEGLPLFVETLTENSPEIEREGEEGEKEGRERNRMGGGVIKTLSLLMQTSVKALRSCLRYCVQCQSSSPHLTIC